MITQYYSSTSTIDPELVNGVPYTRHVLTYHLEVNQQVNYASEPAKGIGECCCVVHGKNPDFLKLTINIIS